jgi:penicillin-binding protein 2
MAERRIAQEWEIRRIGAVGAVMALGFLVLLGRLWQVQVARGEQYRRSLERQSIRRIRVPAPRGRIYDRRGRLLADNRPSYDVVLYIEELRRPGPWSRTLAHIEETIAEIERRIGLPREPDEEAVRQHVRRRLPLPLTVRRDLDETALARWAERTTDLPGVELQVQPVRVYPAGEAAAHLIGYVGRADVEPEADAPFHYALPDVVGRAGIERRYDDRLRGEPGGRLVRVDASGFRRGELGGRPPRPGADLILTVDFDLQRRVAEIFEGQHGAAVVLDPNTGDVLAAVSVPAFDPNAFVPAIPVERWRALSEDPGHPLFNRAFGAAYPPGSTFKPIVALAAGRAGISPEARFSCEGILAVGRRPFHCWERAGHGALDLTSAIRYSCNIYFYRVALQIGPDPILREAGAVGLGRPTGLDADVEASGFLPDPAWKRQARHESWTGGDTCNLAIGQGALTATPIQMAVVASALANGGRRVRPRLLRGTREPGGAEFDAWAPEPPRDLGWSPPALASVREGMRQAVQENNGTAHLARIPGVEAAAKTGTAQYGPPEARRHRGWTIAFAPFESPRVAVAVVVEEAVSGGLTAAPLAREILKAFFGAAAGGSG